MPPAERFLHEVRWAALTALAYFLVETALMFTPERVTDWRTYAVALLGGSVRAVAAGVAVVLYRNRPRPLPPAERVEKTDSP